MKISPNLNPASEPKEPNNNCKKIEKVRRINPYYQMLIDLDKTNFSGETP